MSEPCRQENAIGQLEATTKAIEKTLDRLGDVLEKIASQGTKVDHLEVGQGIIFERLRDMELTAQSEKVKVGFIMAGISAIVSTTVAFIAYYLKR